MPHEYVCKNCSLTFSVGWFHYHDFESGYGAQTLMVCRQCGTCYAVEHRLKSVSDPSKGGNAEISDRQAADRLLGQPHPLFVDNGDVRGLAAFPEVEIDFLPHRFGGVNLLADIACRHCGSHGTITKDWGDNQPCPHCGTIIPEADSRWIT